MTSAQGSNIDVVANATTMLFVPGDRPDRFVKARQSGADLIIIDLEDAVAPENKALALDAVVAALTSPHEEIPGGRLTAVVRINSENSSVELAALRDVSAVAGNGLLGVMVPKAETPQQMSEAIAALPVGFGIVALIESARGLSNAHEIASVPGVTRLGFGAVDFGVDVDATHERVLDYARAQIVIASSAAEIAAPVDSPSLSIKDGEVVSAEALRAREFGFGGKLCIHPAQVELVHSAFAPTSEQVAWAQKVIGLEGGASQLDGVMIDKPVVDRAKRILSRAGAK
ncbi:HpcH/HpaI aldolase/citrate lyase family protein [Aurantimicrobium minutum]|uniref:HpcH/HpaI aldolase/citrate lyase family protein n=1 Tax=Aurantimicrobium minutum TaxID=708131 RepID=UPI00247528BC|nr:CoA ester lyase [Aurantimicrobium minutum]MDH6535808.1 citrate lyase subunit beta/citryl-CoA lyase [Aurantimicrobium minutum]